LRGRRQTTIKLEKLRNRVLYKCLSIYLLQKQCLGWRAGEEKVAVWWGVGWILAQWRGYQTGYVMARSFAEPHITGEMTTFIAVLRRTKQSPCKQNTTLTAQILADGNCRNGGCGPRLNLIVCSKQCGISSHRHFSADRDCCAELNRMEDLSNVETGSSKLPLR
jgi:hypothetical protein